MKYNYQINENIQSNLLYSASRDYSLTDAKNINIDEKQN